MLFVNKICLFFRFMIYYPYYTFGYGGISKFTFYMH